MRSRTFWLRNINPVEIIEITPLARKNNDFLYAKIVSNATIYEIPVVINVNHVYHGSNSVIGAAIKQSHQDYLRNTNQIMNLKRKLEIEDSF